MDEAAGSALGSGLGASTTPTGARWVVQALSQQHQCRPQPGRLRLVPGRGAQRREDVPQGPQGPGGEGVENDRGAESCAGAVRSAVTSPAVSKVKAGRGYSVVAGHVDLDRADIGDHGLGPGAVAGVSGAGTGRVVLLVAEVVGDLALQGGLQDPLGQLLQETALTGQLDASGASPVDCPINCSSSTSGASSTGRTSSTASAETITSLIRCSLKIRSYTEDRTDPHLDHHPRNHMAQEGLSLNGTAPPPARSSANF